MIFLTNIVGTLDIGFNSYFVLLNVAKSWQDYYFLYKICFINNAYDDCIPCYEATWMPDTVSPNIFRKIKSYCFT